MQQSYQNCVSMRDFYSRTHSITRCKSFSHISVFIASNAIILSINLNYVTHAVARTTLILRPTHMTFQAYRYSL